MSVIMEFLTLTDKDNLCESCFMSQKGKKEEKAERQLYPSKRQWKRVNILISKRTYKKSPKQELKDSKTITTKLKY